MGCAAGRVAFSLAQDGHHVTGTDISEHLVKQAQTLAAEQGLNVHFQTCPPNQNLFASDSFDAVLLFKVYCYVPQRQRRIGWLHDIAHVVRPGGFLFLSQYIIDTSVGSYGPIIEELGQRFPALVDELEEGDGFSLPSENDPTVSFIHFFMERDLLGELRASPFQIIDSWRDELLCYCVLQK